MPTIRMTIKYVNEPKEGKTLGSIKGADGFFLAVPKDKLAQFSIGKTYDVEYTEKGDWKSFSFAKEVYEGPHVVATGTPAAAKSCVNKDEQIFVCAILKELISAGHVANDKRQLWEATNMLRGLWGATFGDMNTFHASEASRVARG